LLAVWVEEVPNWAWLWKSQYRRKMTRLISMTGYLSCLKKN